MCPDIEAFAPLVHAVFGAGDTVDEADDAPTSGAPRALRVRLADRSLRQTNPLLAVAAHVLELAGGRLTASEVLDLISREPVRRRFQFDDDDLAQIERWVVDMGVRWGLDADHRAAMEARLGDGQHLVGRSRPASARRDHGRRGAETVRGDAPLDDVPSGTVDLAGRLAELVDRLGRGLRELAGPQPIEGWRDSLGAATEALAAAAPSDAGSTTDSIGCSTRSWPRRGRRRLGRGNRAQRGGVGPGRGPRPLGRPAPGPPDAGQLPDRRPDGVHVGPDALGPTPRRVPARARRRRVSPPRRTGRRRPHRRRSPRRRP